MIRFNELRVTDKCLIIDASVIDLPYYNDVFIDSVIIDTQDTYVASGPSNKPVFTLETEIEYPKIYTDGKQVYDLDDNSAVYAMDDSGKKHIRIELDSKALSVSLENTVFFIYVCTKGTPAPDTPCGMDNAVTMGVAVNLKTFYKSMVCFIKDTFKECELPKRFINAYLRFKAFEMAIKTCHYTEAITIWKKYFMNIRDCTVKLPCGCHGNT